MGRISFELDQQKSQFRISMQPPVENPLMTIGSFNRQFQIGEEERVAVEWGGSRKWERSCFMWSMRIPERPNMKDYQRGKLPAAEGGRSGVGNGEVNGKRTQGPPLGKSIR
jgi:hypothetical protein